MLSHPRPWLDAWAAAAYGTDGFWRTERPADHFRTAASTTELQAAMIAAVAAGSPEIQTIVDLGAGDGQLLTALHRRLREHSFFGVDMRERPEQLVEEIVWCHDTWDVRSTRWTSGEAYVVLATLDRPTMIIAAEWLDDLPCSVHCRDQGSLVVVDVDHCGDEFLGDPASEADHRWASSWWPSGHRVEVGSTRDSAWSTALSHLRVHGGLGVVIDYGHLGSHRPAAGTLVGYAAGQSCPGVPDGTMNLTADVAMDSLAAAGESVGARTVELVRQREAAVALLPRAEPETDPLQDLVRRSERQALTSPSIFGDFWWLLQEVPAVQR